MEELPGWERWYRRQGKAILDDLERRRKVAIRDLLIACGAVVLVGVLSLTQIGFTFEMLYVLFFSPILFILMEMVARTSFQHQYKSELMPKLIRRLGRDFTYTPRGKVAREAYDKCGLFYRPVSLGGYQGEDLLVGRVDGVPLTLSELSVNTPHGDSTFTIFQGLFMHAPLREPVLARLTVTMNNWTRVMTRSDEEPDGLAPRIAFDGVFDARFTVRSSSEAEARRLVTPAFQARLMTLAAEAMSLGKEDDAPMADWQYAFQVDDGSEPSLALSIVDDRLFIAIQTGKDLFDPKLFRPANHPGTVKRYMAYLELLTGVLGELGFVVADEPAEAVAS